MRNFQIWKPVVQSNVVVTHDATHAFRNSAVVGLGELFLHVYLLFYSFTPTICPHYSPACPLLFSQLFSQLLFLMLVKTALIDCVDRLTTYMYTNVCYSVNLKTIQCSLEKHDIAGLQMTM